ncbi:hypothetical protein GGI12_004249 [Dipsacomyces acuminosporus]|nr:hypothetical protein GGI12_004249 [Dipsacomyces acuminosporus]
MTVPRRSSRRSAGKAASLEKLKNDVADDRDEESTAEASNLTASDSLGSPDSKRARSTNGVARKKGQANAADGSSSPASKKIEKKSTGDKRKRESGTDGGERPAAKQISAQEEADLSSALIAKLLAEDAGGQYMGYYDDYGNGGAYGGDAFDDYASGSEADDDWDPSSKSRRASKGNKPQPKSRRSLVAPGQYRSGAYTDEEEQKFNEGLELYGRSWNQISLHLGTRDPKSIRSHAQKYFIKLFRDKLPLPAKVLESGEGYTLSGRPLDPNSAAARPYLQHVMQLDPPPPKAPKPVKAAGASSAQPSQDRAPDGSTVCAGGDDRAKEQAAAATPAAASTADATNGQPASESGASGPGEENANDSQAKEPATAPNGSASAKSVPVPAQGDEIRTPQRPKTPVTAPSPALPKSPVRTEYAMSRPQRNHTRHVALQYNDPHQMVRCTPFPGQPLSGVAGCQPFRLVVHTNAQLQMDFHAHLMVSEVIGLLGGRWDAEAKVLTVTRAFPCTALESEEAHTNVEMDPGSELEVRHQINEAGLRVVGWYHSHPTFRPDPSIIDIENQTAYQTLFHDNESSEEPFVGAIVGPYDPELPGPLSVFNWFCVGRTAVDRGHPKRLMVETAPDSCLPDAEQDILFALMGTSSELKHHAALEEAWRPSSTEMRSLKMAVSLALRMPWLIAAEATAGAQAPAQAATAENSSAEEGMPEAPGTASDCTVSEAAAATATAVEANDKDDFESIDKKIPQALLLAGQRAVQDPFLAALSRRFTAGAFKAGADGKLSEPSKLERVFAAYFLQWGSS